MSCSVRSWLLRLLAFICTLAQCAFDESLVRGQYEAFPYPYIGTKNISEYPHLHPQHTLKGANHFIYDGELFERLAQGHHLRILIAGGGVGRETISYAGELKQLGVSASVVHLDFSLTSIDLARKWVAEFELEEYVEFVHGSIEQFVAQHETHASPPFDIINSMGVLHHLEHPEHGLKLLRKILAPDGGMHILVYGRHGRAGIYEIQEALRYSLPVSELLTNSERISELQNFLNSGGLPQTSVCRHNTVCYGGNESDTEIYDRLLHAQDQAYSVVEFQDFIRSADLRIISLVPEATYEPSFTVFKGLKDKSSYMARRLNNRKRIEQFHFTELMTSRPGTHAAWVAPNKASTLSISPLGFEDVTERRLRRRQTQWRHHFKPRLVELFGGYTPDQVATMKNEVFKRQGSRYTMTLKVAIKAVADVPLPLLSFAFHDAAKLDKFSSEEIIRLVRKDASQWLLETDALQQHNPLSYDEVAEEYFQWFDAMESMAAVYSERISSNVSAHRA